MNKKHSEEELRTNGVPNPGSEEAYALGCICPQMDNGHGHGCGYTDDDGNPLFYIHENCPVHGDLDKE